MRRILGYFEFSGEPAPRDLILALAQNKPLAPAGTVQTYGSHAAGGVKNSRGIDSFRNT